MSENKEKVLNVSVSFGSDKVAYDTVMGYYQDMKAAANGKLSFSRFVRDLVLAAKEQKM